MVMKKKQLKTYSVLSSVSHGEPEWSIVLELEVFISKLSTIDALAASSIASGEITTLNHEVFNDTVEFRTSISQLSSITVSLKANNVK